MDIATLAAKVPVAWRDDFVRFVETGEAEPEFLNAMNADVDIRTAVDSVLDEQESSFHQMAAALSRPVPIPTVRGPVATPASNPLAPAKRHSTGVYEVISGVVGVTGRGAALKAEDRVIVVREARSALDPAAKEFLRELTK